MADVFTVEKRSAIMRAIRSSGNRSTELRLAGLLRKARLSGWRRTSRLPGRPDFVFHRERVAVFVDGCFWHGCSRCIRKVKSNARFWSKKITRNRARDRRVSRDLRSKGWTVIRIWEHELRPSSAALPKRLVDAVNKRRNLLPHGGPIP